MSSAAQVAPVCLQCHYERYRKIEPQREWPTTDKTCHLCGMTTGMGYSVTVASAPSGEPS